MSKYQYPKLEGMDAILLHLNLNHKGNWMEVYDSLQAREHVDFNQLSDQINWLEKHNCGYLTLISNEYPESYKSIYKPPFGIMVKGDYEFIKGTNAQKDTITVIGDHKEAFENLPNTKNFLWVNKTNKEIDEIVKIHPEGNIFYCSELKTTEKMKDLPKGNCYISEVWEKAIDKDYSNQKEERVFLGITKKVHVTKNADRVAEKRTREYAKLEDVFFIYDEKQPKKSKGIELGR